ncbi:MAG: heme ABC exporter ATP-binding protein CcmA [Anaerolineae bacterium]|nr:heme ABC exporter ATP-binding protein CcmA [Anaerolineae bacterium]
MIETRKLVKTFGMRPVLRGVNLTVETGRFLALFGPNGSGKTTLMRILATLSRPSGGAVRVGGRRLPQQADAVRRRLGVVLHQPLLYDDLTAAENLAFFGRMYDLGDIPGRAAAMLKRVGLAARAHDPVRTFSRGMQQRLSIGRAILHDPDILLLDEPYTGLDTEAAALLDDLLHEVVADRPRTILLVTHDLARGLAHADTIAVLKDGKIVHTGPRADFTGAEAFADLYTRVTGAVLGGR